MARYNYPVILIRGVDAVKKYLSVQDLSTEAMKMIYKSIDIYEFDTEEEAEAFRMGLCAVCEDKADDFCEMSGRGYKNFLALLRKALQAQKVAI
jgi:hypothetical protein